MAPNDSAEATEEARDLVAGRRKAARYLVPVAIAGVAAATIGLVPALASSGDPDLPKITAQELIAKIAASDTQQLSGTVKVSTDLGLPSLGGMTSSFAPGGASGGGEGGSASPTSKLTELATGTHTLRVAADGPDRQKVSILENAAEYSLIHNGSQIWGYDSKSNEAFHATTGKSTGKSTAKPEKSAGADMTPKALADEALKAADATTSVTVDGTAQVAGRDAYQLLIKPKQSGTTVGSIRVAVDAKNGTPLKFTLIPSGGGKAVVDAGFTKVDFSKPSASTFNFTPPKGAKVTEGDTPKAESGADLGKGLDKGLDKGKGHDNGMKVIGKGWTSIAAFDTGGKGLDAGGPAEKGKGGAGPDAQKFLDSLGDKVSGTFGSGTVFHTRLINALMTDDGKVYVGAVDKAALVAAANAAK
ncbi:LolA family protein [Streptomyces beijiangensis]|uniref:Outer membrane lipoprotein carrier protein LolA n=1 Tax=Streptomyces beijiangensis TaxID=163361 RepID=A0A939F4X7_9ACTN|nr:outer membrane lipoprotein carrier protein LolA [Streptomyces beijiangensis]MBO0512152.1 outer membrane lipoprotein carrier protein LolA [Streptomyces beijiangensis]